MKPNTCLVVDVWEWQLEINEAVLKANGVAGIGIRLNDMNGGHHMDKNFLKQWQESKNFVRFPYFVYNPWVDGAANFAWLLANVPVEVLTVAVDVEVRMAGYSPVTYAAEVGKFLELCAPRWKVIIYTAEWFLPFLSQWPRVDYWWAQYPDSKMYFDGVKTWDDLKLHLDNLDKPFNMGAVPGTLKMWQFSGDSLILPGYSNLLDVDLFYGTEQDLANYFNTGPVTAPPPKPGLYTFNGLNYYPRPTGLPLTLPVGRVRRLTDNVTQLYWPVLKQMLTKLNSSNPAALDLIVRPDWGLNKGRDGDMIKWAGTLWPGRNVVKIEEVLVDLLGKAWGRVEGANKDSTTLNIYDNPELVHMVYDYQRVNGWVERAKPVYVPILDGSWWVQMDLLASIDGRLPKTVKIKAFPRLNVRADTNVVSATVGYKYYGEAVVIEQVKIGKGGIWGKVSTGWIALRNNGTNWTDWKI